MGRTAKPAFTLLEVMMVVILLGALAAIVLPSFSSATDDTKAAAVNNELTSVRSAIIRYRLEIGKFPGYTAAGVAETDAGKTPASLLVILSTRDLGSGRGPWLQSIPKNAFDNLATVNGVGGWDYSVNFADNTCTFNADTTSIAAGVRSAINNL